MKTRIGFVSNSSSTSFCIISTKEDFESIEEQFSYSERDFITSLIGSPQIVEIDKKSKYLFFGTINSEDLGSKYKCNVDENCDWQKSYQKAEEIKNRLFDMLSKAKNTIVKTDYC